MRHNPAVEELMVGFVRMGWAIRIGGMGPRGSFRLMRCPFCLGEDVVTIVEKNGRTRCVACRRVSNLVEVARLFGFEPKHGLDLSELGTRAPVPDPRKSETGRLMSANATPRRLRSRRIRKGKRPGVERVIK